MLNRLWCSTENPEVVTHLQSHRRYIHSSIGQRTCEEFYSVDSHRYICSSGLRTLLEQGDNSILSQEKFLAVDLFVTMCAEFSVSRIIPNS